MNRFVFAWLILPVLWLHAFGCKEVPNHPIYSYSWIHFEFISRDSTGKISSMPQWNMPVQLNIPDTFVVYPNTDSIRMITPDMPGGSLFVRTSLDSYKWKPRPSYGNGLQLLGLFERRDLPGMLFSFYATKDRSSLLQVVYTNPGNMNTAMLFSSDSANVLKLSNIIIDPAGEESEPEKGVVRQ
ncbi:MAG: hypothetical protein JO154_06420 [Chitinophaga sp.]|uniref:hypothetical protein n=1 Tax=Chitinophaga sp. TaxID=1869181 RepID=UPI0025C25573|nr:hypothetical protein [Chitinophaga sp.]MBV8252227.1 hypothetical protein [Chitinophaga sp.]